MEIQAFERNDQQLARLQWTMAACAGLGLCWLLWLTAAPQHWPGGLAVLCPGTIPDALIGLHQRLGQALREHHLPVSARALAPHVTLARRCNRIEMPAVCPPITWLVQDYALVLSTGDIRQRYVQLETYGACRADGHHR